MKAIISQCARATFGRTLSSLNKMVLFYTLIGYLPIIDQQSLDRIANQLAGYKQKLVVK